jgi:hypothetical protein
MDELEDCQLKFESLRRQFEVRQDLFGEDQDSSLRIQLKRVEGSLRSILREYERGFLVRRNLPAMEPIVISEALREFIENKKSEQNTDDESEQKSNMTLARNLIKKLIEERSSKALG